MLQLLLFGSHMERNGINIYFMKSLKNPNIFDRVTPLHPPLSFSLHVESQVSPRGSHHEIPRGDHVVSHHVNHVERLISPRGVKRKWGGGGRGVTNKTIFYLKTTPAQRSWSSAGSRSLLVSMEDNRKNMSDSERVP